MQEEDSPFEVDFNFEKLEEAATYDFLSLYDGIHVKDQELGQVFKISYLRRVYQLIKNAFEDKPLIRSRDLVCAWEDKLWIVFVTKESELNQYIPSCQIPGSTIHVLLWKVLCGLMLINHSWRAEPPWKNAFYNGITGRTIPFVLNEFLLLYDIPVIHHTVNELMGELFVLTSRFYDLEYHPDLEIWINMLLLQTAKLMYHGSTNQIYNSPQYCMPRTATSDYYVCSPLFDQETCRLFYDFKSALYRYNQYPRIIISINRRNLDVYEKSVMAPQIHEMEIPYTRTLLCTDDYIRDLFFLEGEDETDITTRWTKWVETNLKELYHDRSRITLQKSGLIQVLRPGELSRGMASNAGVPPGEYSLLKKNRSMKALDHYDYHAFRVPWENLFKDFANLNRPHDRLRDAAFLYLVDQYMHHRFHVRFIACFCKNEYDFAKNPTSLDKEDHPILIQNLGGWDVYFVGEIIHTRNVCKAFLVWCYKIASKFNGHVFKTINLQNMLAGLVTDVKTPESVAPSQSLKPRSKYWI